MELSSVGYMNNYESDHPRMAMTPNNPENGRTGGVSLAFKVGILGICLSVAVAAIARQVGLSDMSIVVLLIGGMDLSAIAAAVLGMGPRYTLLEFFVIFIAVSAEIGVLINFPQIAKTIGIGPAFFVSLLFGMYVILIGGGIARRISRKKSDILAETQESHEN